MSPLAPLRSFLEGLLLASRLPEINKEAFIKIWSVFGSRDLKSRAEDPSGFSTDPDPGSNLIYVIRKKLSIDFQSIDIWLIFYIKIFLNENIS